MCDSTQGSLCPSPMKIHQSMWIQWLFCKNLKQMSLTPRWPLTPYLLRSHVWLYPRIIVSKSYENTLKYVDTVTLFAKTWNKGHWPLDDLWPHICWGLMCDSTQGSLCPSPMKIHQSMWIQWPFLPKKNLNQRSLTPRWPLTPHLLRSHLWLYPRIILSKSHENTSKYVDTVNLFAKTWTKGHWPLDDLWPHICWGHMCDCAQGSLCPSPMGIHQCMWIQLSILQKLPHTYIHILRTYYVHTTYYVQNQWSHSLFLNYVQARQKGVKFQFIHWKVNCKKGKYNWSYLYFCDCELVDCEHGDFSDLYDYEADLALLSSWHGLVHFKLRHFFYVCHYSCVFWCH